MMIKSTILLVSLFFQNFPKPFSLKDGRILHKESIITSDDCKDHVLLNKEEKWQIFSRCNDKFKLSSLTGELVENLWEELNFTYGQNFAIIKNQSQLVVIGKKTVEADSWFALNNKNGYLVSLENKTKNKTWLLVENLKAIELPAFLIPQDSDSTIYHVSDLIIIKQNGTPAPALYQIPPKSYWWLPPSVFLRPREKNLLKDGQKNILFRLNLPIDFGFYYYTVQIGNLIGRTEFCEGGNSCLLSLKAPTGKYKLTLTLHLEKQGHYKKANNLQQTEPISVEIKNSRSYLVTLIDGKNKPWQIHWQIIND